MPAFSGLWDGVHGTAYGGTFPTSEPIPALAGLARVLFQKRGMFGIAKGLGISTITSRKQVQTDRGDLSVIGGMEAWPSRDPDAANKVTIANAGDDVNTLEDANTVPSNGADLHVFNTTLNHTYADDAADSGVTAQALTGRHPT